jgi:hypothetical protein
MIADEPINPLWPNILSVIDNKPPAANAWHLVSERQSNLENSTYRMLVPGGWLYRYGSHMTFVPLQANAFPPPMVGAGTYFGQAQSAGGGGYNGHQGNSAAQMQLGCTARGNSLGQ